MIDHNFALPRSHRCVLPVPIKPDHVTVLRLTCHSQHLDGSVVRSVGGPSPNGSPGGRIPTLAHDLEDAFLTGYNALYGKLYDEPISSPSLGATTTATLDPRTSETDPRRPV